MRWYHGHWYRHVPAGYVESLETGRNVIRDRDLARLYDVLRLVTRGPLFGAGRLEAIWELNVGRYDWLVDEDFYRHAEMPRLRLADVGEAKPAGYRWDARGTRVFKSDGLQVDLGRESHARRIVLSLDGNDRYELRFMRGLDVVATVAVGPMRQPGLAVYRVETPAAAVAHGFSRVRIMPLSGDDKLSLGHLLLLGATGRGPSRPAASHVGSAR